MSIIRIVPGATSAKIRLNGVAGNSFHIGQGGGGAIQQLVGATGGTVSLASLSVPGAIEIPAGALASDVTITAASVSAASVSIANTSVVGAALQLGPEGQSFSQPVTITITVDLASLPVGVSISDLVIYTAPVGSSNFTALTTTVVDPTHISAQVDHFSNFVVTAPAQGGGGGAVQDGSFDNPYILPLDGSENQYSISFSNGDHGAFFKFTMDPSVMGSTSAAGWGGELTGYSKVVQLAARASWTPAGQYASLDHNITVRAQPAAGWSSGNYYDLWSNYQSSTPKTAFLNCHNYINDAAYWGFGGGPGNAAVLGSQWNDGGSQYINAPMFIWNTSHYGVTTLAGDWMFYVDCPYYAEGYTGGNITVMSRIITP